MGELERKVGQQAMEIDFLSEPCSMSRCSCAPQEVHTKLTQTRELLTDYKTPKITPHNSGGNGAATTSPFARRLLVEDPCFRRCSARNGSSSGANQCPIPLQSHPPSHGRSGRQVVGSGTRKVFRTSALPKTDSKACLSCYRQQPSTFLRIQQRGTP